VRSLVWFRGKDLRLADHAPLTEAVRSGETIPLFVLDPCFFAPERARRLAPRMQVLLDALAALDEGLRRRGSGLVLATGRSVDVVPALARQWNVDRVLAHRWSEPFGRERDRRIGEALGVPFELFEGETLAPPGAIAAPGGQPHAVFTAFARAFVRQGGPGAPLPAPERLPALPPLPSVPLPTLRDLGLSRNEHIPEGGEPAGRKRLEAFLGQGLAAYATDRDRLDLAGTSRLSMDLHFGTVSVRELWIQASRRLGEGFDPDVRAFQNELLWREFAHHWLWARPDLLRQPFRTAFEGFPWHEDEDLWQAWALVRTGYPLVDAAARQLLGEGFVHNRARMVAASFLAKHLLLDFRRGEAHYLAHLADGDWANNDLGWQWSAGCGCDAQPWFRIFNPVLQGTRFDPDGAYVRRWVPELAGLPARWIHQPEAAPAEVLARAGVVPGRTYPRPVVGHAAARARFLENAKRHLGR
jgi:deoxyribodipyrimidine photo-lyase